jgi:hypothetical protein
LFQLSNDFSESEGDVSFDILKEAELGSQNPNSVCDEGPEVAGVVGAEALSGCAEWLAGIAATEDVHAAVKLCPWEGFKIRPDRCRVHESRFHFRDQVRAGEGFDLTKSDCAQTWDCSAKSEINASVSGTKADVCSCLGSIHIFIFFFFRQAFLARLLAHIHTS